MLSQPCYGLLVVAFSVYTFFQRSTYQQCPHRVWVIDSRTLDAEDDA